MAFGEKDPSKFADINEANGWWKCGTLADLMENQVGFTQGKLLPKDAPAEDASLENGIVIGDATATVALHMQETAGNEYQNLSLGNVYINLVATQWTYEEDGMGDNQYDVDAPFDPYAAVTELGETTVDVFNNTDADVEKILTAEGKLKLNATFQFKPTQTLAQAQLSPYRYYHADYAVYADRDVAADSVALAGYYKAWCGDNGWVVMPCTENILVTEFNKENPIRLVEVLGTTVNYEEICEFGNDGIGFMCGVANLDVEKDTTLTVELRLYETTGDPSTTTGPKNEETGEYTVIGTYTYVLEGKNDN